MPREGDSVSTLDLLARAREGDARALDQLIARYLPELARLDEAQMPAIDDYAQWLGPVRVIPVPIPHDCSDGFLYAYWRRPTAYLDPRIRSGSSSFWAIGDAVEPGLARLAHDLESGEWRRRYAELLTLESYDAGYRLIVANG